MQWGSSQVSTLKIKVLDYTYTSEPSIYTALPLRKSLWKSILFVIATVLTLGIYWLIANWSQRHRAALIYVVCSLQLATHLLVEQEDRATGSLIVEQGNRYELRMRRTCVSFSYHDRNYLYIEEKEVFVPIRYVELGQHLDRLRRNNYSPIGESERVELLQYYGQNVMRLQVQNRLDIFIQEMLTPFEMIQGYGMLLCLYEKYYIFMVIYLAYSLYSYWSNADDVRVRQERLAFQSYFDVNTRVLVEDSEHEQVQLRKSNIQPDRPEAQIVKQNFNSICLDQGEAELDSDRRGKANHRNGLREREVTNEQNELINNRKTLCKNMSSHRLVPGDLIILEDGDVVPCDCVLIRGEALVRQSYTTGEPYIVRKKQLPHFTYNSQEESTYVLYLGSQIVKIYEGDTERRPNLEPIESSLPEALPHRQLVCLVTNTNYNTLRGKFLRQIRYQRKPRGRFAVQSMYFLFIVFLSTVLVYVILVTKLWNYLSGGSLLIFFFDLLFTSVPPTLPTVMTVGVAFVQHTLTQNQISCVIPSAIFAGGRVDTVVLDADNLFANTYQVHGAVIGARSRRSFGLTFASIEELKMYSQAGLEYSGVQDLKNKTIQKRQLLRCSHLFVAAISCCHSLQFYQNEIEGSEAEKHIFKFSKAKFLHQDSYETEHYFAAADRIFHLKNSEKILSVIATLTKKTPPHLKLRNESELQNYLQQSQNIRADDKFLFVKGPAEQMLLYCEASTYSETAKEYIVDMAEKGFSLWCYAYIELVQDYDGDEIRKFFSQKHLLFLGFMVMRQTVSPDTKQALSDLKEAHVQVIIASTNNQLEASSQAILNGLCEKNELLLCDLDLEANRISTRGHTEWSSSTPDCVNQFLKEIADFTVGCKLSLTSDLFDALRRSHSSNIAKVLSKIAVLNKMELRHQRGLYDQFNKMGKETLAVGGGGKVAECASVSLQLKRESSSQLSSFHTKSDSLSHIVNCLKICRAGLSTNLHCFKMVLLFSLTQFTTVVILAVYFQELKQWQMLFEDLFVTLPIFVTINFTQTSLKLSRQLPPSSFFSRRNLCSMGGQLVLQIGAQMGFMMYLTERAYIANLLAQAEQDALEYQELQQTELALALFILSNYLYLGIALSTSVSKPFRKPFYTNILYLINVAALWVYSTGIVLFPSWAPHKLRGQLSTDGEFVLVVGMVVGNLVMLSMYLFQNLLVFLWSEPRLRMMESVEMAIIK